MHLFPSIKTTFLMYVCMYVCRLNYIYGGMIMLTTSIRAVDLIAKICKKKTNISVCVWFLAVFFSKILNFCNRSKSVVWCSSSPIYSFCKKRGQLRKSENLSKDSKHNLDLYSFR